MDVFKHYEIDLSTGCWIWKGSTRGGGYPQVSKSVESTRYGHRAFYKYYVGDLPDNLLVCHKCDNPICVNPDHLFLGTCKDNLRDMINKGRAKYLRGKDHYRYNKPKESHPMFGKRHTEESKLKISIKNTGTNHPLFGKSCTEERRIRISIALTGHKRTQESKEKQAATIRSQNRIMPDYQKQALRLSNIGKKKTQEEIIRRTETRKRNKELKDGILALQK